MVSLIAADLPLPGSQSLVYRGVVVVLFVISFIHFIPLFIRHAVGGLEFNLNTLAVEGISRVVFKISRIKTFSMHTWKNLVVINMVVNKPGRFWHKRPRRYVFFLTLSHLDSDERAAIMAGLKHVCDHVQCASQSSSIRS